MAATSTKTTPTSEIPELAQKIREHLVSTVQKGQQLSLDAAKTWVKVASVIPVPDLPTVPGITALPAVETATTYTFDLAAELLSLQRDFAVELTNVLTPAKSA